MDIVVQIEGFLDGSYHVKLADWIVPSRALTAYQPVDRAVSVVAGPYWIK